MQDCKGVIGIIGMPYCGSTILSYILGSHTEIYGGADLYKLSPAYDAGCSLHGDKCTLWTRENRDSVYRALEKGQVSYYNRICELSSKSYICDASKNPSYFNNRVLGIDCPTLLVNLCKHPLRHVCSLLFNHHFVKEKNIRGESEIKSYLSEDWGSAISFIESSISRIYRHNEEVEEVKFSLGNESWLDIKYEDIVSNSKQMISTINQFFGLSFQDGQLQFQNHDLHPIVGNTGPRRKINIGKSPVPLNSDLRASFYDSGNSSIQMDQKYRLIFNSEQIDAINRINEFEGLCNYLGYPLSPD